jgi:hypothetical protein
MSAENERCWPGGLTTEEVIARVTKGYLDEKARLEALAAKRKAREQARTQKVVEFPSRLSELELIRRQAIIDQHWQAMLDEKALLRREAERRSFNKAPGDPDWKLRDDWVWGK